MIDDFELNLKGYDTAYYISCLHDREFTNHSFHESDAWEPVVGMEMSRVDGVYKIEIKADTDYFGELPCVDEIREIEKQEKNVYVSAVDDFNEDDFVEWYMAIMRKYDDFLNERWSRIDELNDEIMDLYHSIESHPNTEESREEYEEARLLIEDIERYKPDKWEATYMYYF